MGKEVHILRRSRNSPAFRAFPDGFQSIGSIIAFHPSVLENAKKAKKILYNTLYIVYQLIDSTR
jgi:hypothetical protein